jgi:hypothetical protein
MGPLLPRLTDPAELEAVSGALPGPFILSANHQNIRQINIPDPVALGGG